MIEVVLPSGHVLSEWPDLPTLDRYLTRTKFVRLHDTLYLYQPRPARWYHFSRIEEA